MKILLTNDYSLHIGTAEGVVVYEGRAGETLTVPDDVAVLFFNAGAAEPVKTAEKAVKTKGETATK